MLKSGAGEPFNFRFGIVGPEGRGAECSDTDVVRDSWQGEPPMFRGGRKTGVGFAVRSTDEIEWRRHCAGPASMIAAANRLLRRVLHIPLHVEAVINATSWRVLFYAGFTVEQRFIAGINRNHIPFEVG